MGVVNQASNLIDRVIRLERRVNEIWHKIGLTAATISKGGLTLLDGAFLRMALPSGVDVVKIGELTDTDGTTYQGIEFRRPDGSRIFATVPINGDPDLIAWVLYDQLGRRIVASDAATGGLALPWLAVPMYPLFSMAANSFYGYMTVDAAQLAGEKTLWEGRINKVLGPFLQVNGVWGQASGSNSTSWRLMVDGAQVGAWTSAGLEAAIKGPFDVSARFNTNEATVQLRATATGTGQVAAQVLGLTQRQT